MAMDTPRGLFVRSFEYPSGYIGNRHQHRLAQIVYPVRGVVCVETDAGRVTVSPYRAVAVPSWHTHRVSAKGNVSLRSIFLDPIDSQVPAVKTEVLQVNTLLHELIQEAGNHYGDVLASSVADQVLRLLVMKTQDVADRLALSARQFRRIFKRHTGMAFQDWRNIARINKAIEIIASGESVTSVAAELSYSSCSALGQVFRQYTGMTPTEFALMQDQPR